MIDYGSISIADTISTNGKDGGPALIDLAPVDYYYKVFFTAVDSAANESEYSDPLYWKILEQDVPPDKMTGIRVIFVKGEEISF